MLQPPLHAPRLVRLLGPVIAVALALALATTMTTAPSAHAAPGASVKTSGLRAPTVDTSQIDIQLRRRTTFRQRVMRISRSKRGAPYRYGAAGPRRFDCSGYTSWVFRKAGKRIPRTSRQQAAASRRVKFRNRRRGDLVFFHNRGRVYHVGIYAGRGRIWHSPSTGKRVSRQRIWTRSHFYGRFR